MKVFLYIDNDISSYLLKTTQLNQWFNLVSALTSIKMSRIS
jgi:hypothetical protein